MTVDTSEAGIWERYRLPQAEQTSSAPSRSTGESSERLGALEEIIVTATKREERMLDVPMSIATLGGRDIDRRGLIELRDYLPSIPGVNVVDVGGRSNQITIRGIASSGNNGAGATTSTYFDEPSITGSGGVVGGGSDVRPVDLERIEVLRGPQGTAFGDASLGGTLRYVTAKPNLKSFSTKFSGAIRIPAATAAIIRSFRAS